MESTAKNLQQKFSYADYLNWPQGERFELIDGIAYDMSPAPGTVHQTVSGELFGIIWQFLKNKKCRVFSAPFDVRLPEMKKATDAETFTVVQPDITVICDENKIDERGCKGAPDVVIEILSQSSAYRDETEKLLLYEKHGVKEYWIVNPDAKYVMIYRNNEKKFEKPEYLRGEDILESRVLTGLSFKLTDIWEKKP
jgi:Uma2 family endonuclease